MRRLHRGQTWVRLRLPNERRGRVSSAAHLEISADAPCLLCFGYAQAT